MTRSERHLAILLRVFGTVNTLAFVVALGVVFLLLLARARGEVCATEEPRPNEEDGDTAPDSAEPDSAESSDS